MLKYILFVLTYQITAIVCGNQPCLGAPQNPHSFAASPAGCDAYILCMNGQTFTDRRCPQGFLFDPLSQTCSSSTCMECSPFGIQNLPHPLSCDQYIECVMGVRKFQTCQNGLMFDPVIGDCNTADKVVCSGQPSNPSSTTTSIPIVTTTVAVTTTTAATTTLSTTPLCIPDNAYHAHPSDCTKYVICIDSEILVTQCPTNLHWNKSLGVCDTPETAGCQIGGGGGQPTNPSTPCPPMIP